MCDVKWEVYWITCPSTNVILLFSTGDVGDKGQKGSVGRHGKIGPIGSKGISDALLASWSLAGPQHPDPLRMITD